MKLRAIILILALIAFFSVSTGGYLYYSSIKESAFHEAERHMVTHTRVIKDRVALFLSENLKSVKALAGLNDLQQALLRPAEGNLARANTILDHFQDSLAVNVCYVMDTAGKTIASSNRKTASSFVGKNYGFRPYFGHAIKGIPAVYMALGVTSGRRGVYYSHPVYDVTQSDPIGVAIVKAPIDRIERELNYRNHSYENVVLITDPNGVIFISDHENWLYKVLWKSTDEQIAQIASTRQFGNGPWQWSGLVLKDNNRAVKASGGEYLIHQENIDNYPGWKIIHLSNLSSIKRMISDSFIKSTGYITLIICIIVGLSVFFLYNRASSDIVKRKRAEQALQDRENLLRTVINATKEAMIAIGQDGLITIFNPAAEQMFGQKRENMIGQTLDVLMPENYRTQHAGFIRSYFSKGEPKSAIGKTMELPAIRGDHTVFSMEISLATGNYGNKRFVIAVARDITARKRAEAELRESEQNYRSIYNAANDTIFIHDIKSGEILDVNERIQDVYGYTPDEAKRLNVGAISSGEAPYTQEHALEWIVKAADGKPQLFEWLSKDKHGRLFWVEVNLKKVVIGGRDRLLAVVRDIDARKRNEETQNKLQVQIQQSQRLESIGTLAGGIAHDFNNLLMTIEGSASLMLYDIEPDHPHFDILQNIEKQVRSGAKLTAQLLGYARKGKYELKPVDLNYLVEETLETFGRTKKEIRIQPNLSDDLSIIEADPGQIEQMLLNLCINASDAMPEGGELKIKTENVTHKVMKSEVFQPTPGQYVLLAITDSGIGMNQVTQERIFEPFYTTKEMGRGTGLGMASVYGVVKSHGGFIDVESKKGSGTTFRIYLPASEKAVEETPEDLPEVTEESGTILLVDDEQMVCAVGTQMLQKFGYTVLQAGSGREAIDLYAENKDEIDLVILDMIMPDLSGGKVYDRMKEINANVTVLLSSGYSIDGQASEIMERGCDGFIQKPFNMKLLSHKVLEVLHKGR